MPKIAEQHLVDRFASALAELPQVAVDTPTPLGQGIDAVLTARVAGEPVTILVEVKRGGYPRDARQAMWQLRNYFAHQPENEDGRSIAFVFVTEALSQGAKKLLQDENIGYYDLGGSLFLPAKGAYLYIDKPTPSREGRILRGLFTGKRAQVLHVGFFERDWFGVTELAHKTRVSPATVSDTLTELDRREWVESRGEGPAKQRRLIDRKALLDAWKTHQLSTRPPKLKRYYVPTKGAGPLMRSLSIEFEKHGIRYAVTGEVAAQHYTPYLSAISQVRCRIMPGRLADDALRAIDAHPVSEGWNLGVLESKSGGEFIRSEQIEGVWMSSPLQTYLDLLQGDGRSKELAEHLRSERLRS